MSVQRPAPSTGFAVFPLGVSLQRGIAAAGFVDPRPIQHQTIPAALEGRDVLGLAQTGTGKTAAYVLPLLERLLAVRRPGPRVLVVAPTRELARQVEEETRTLARFTGIRTTTVFGGVPAGNQVAAVRQAPEIVVACPGRLLDLHQRGAVRFDRIEALVLDEADHMLDMGFLPDLRRILAALPAVRQNLLFSATMPREIRQLAHQVLKDPYVAELGHSRPAATVEQAFYHADSAEKRELLEGVLREPGFSRAIVFTRTKHRAKRLARQLGASGHRAVALQGNMTQSQRERAMDGFRRRLFDILVATDIAARGIDVEKVSHVVNFDMPGTVDAYIHRIGRTGRAERGGKAYTFVTSEDRELARALEQQTAAPVRPRVHAGRVARAARPSPRGRRRRTRGRRPWA